MPRALRRKPVVYAAMALALSGVFEAGHIAWSQQQQQQQQPPVDFKARGQDVLAHLNSVLRFYRESTAPVQKMGEPNDIVYREQAVALVSQAAEFAFQSAKAEAELMASYQKHQGGATESAGSAEQQRMQTVASNIDKQLADLKTRGDALDQQIATARPKDHAALVQQRKQVGEATDLANAMKDALQKITGISDAKGNSGLGADIESLQRSVPELNSKTAPVAAQLTTLDAARSSGVSSQTIALFELLSSEHTLDGLIHDNDSLHQQALALRTPISSILRGLIGRGQQLSQQVADAPPAVVATPAPAKGKKGAAAPVAAAPKAAAPDAAAPGSTDQSLGSIATTFKALSTASVPLSQEIIVLERNRANLTAWKAAVDREYKSILHALLLRLLVMAVALAVIFAGGEVWTHATNKYVRDMRRRRQVMLMRRTVVGFLSAIVLLFGFVTQFNSLATFAGFITAGVAVGLQTILLSVAAYFFIIGRYGIKVGDRITIASVTGDVIDVGLVRFYMMELAGTGTELNPTGRVAVFSNAVLFQAGAPLYKQIPGTEYAWHELIVKLTETADYKTASDAILKVVQGIYDTYRGGIEQQHRDVEQWMQTSIVAPGVESRLQLVGGVLQLWARFPVQIKQAADTDERLTEALLGLLEKNEAIKAAVAAMPVIQPSIKG
ncbi:mechanosensitive ion channel [Granulicella sp. WH15]|uniref:mechanosensitive ion channel domain-containing protein n=1 Tax=Granulicella sp. WH15 TaxID=2602070 RepID=UPI00136798AA|nr:mechanosensitive ion channel domain-containing protein [Granulicella sp. WH15]QHN04134.1 mechanosensitive ion channel [Granulicella sp. WH15]